MHANRDALETFILENDAPLARNTTRRYAEICTAWQCKRCLKLTRRKAGVKVL